MASPPHNKHVYNVANFDMIQEVQKRIITEVCSGVEDQLSFLVSGEESKSVNCCRTLYIIWDSVILTQDDTCEHAVKMSFFLSGGAAV